ncbi:porin [Vibrio mediterranei]|uniref:porin n=1 Tax=Vibrio mediterranei TaxID=689 RepID=UPI002284AA09|nr:porin [Vibrio mediterranei]MCY9856109.1 porin [Vibrio mediterranei]
MKKTWILISLLTSTSSFAVPVYESKTTNLDLYGRIYAGIFSGDYGEKNQSFTRLGTKFDSTFNDGVKGIARMELQYGMPDSGEKLDNIRMRLAFGGIETNYGTVTFGRDYGALELLAGKTMRAFADGFGNKAIGQGTDKFGTGRSSNLLKYAVHIHNLELNTSVVFANSTTEFASNKNTDKSDSQKAAGIAGLYTFDNGLSAGLGYNYGERPDDKPAHELAIAFIGYQKDKFKAAVNYGHGKNTTHFKHDHDYYGHNGIDAYANYKITKQFEAQVYYSNLVVEGQSDADGKGGRHSALIGARYFFSPRAQAIVEYKFDLRGNDADWSDTKAVKGNEVTFGLRYDF